jgi:hypothetical protein
MTYREPLSQKAIAISISDSAEMAGLGLGPEHLRDAMAEIARHLLAMGARLVYGGDLRAGGFTELLFELATRHHRDADVGDFRSAVVNYLAWPIYTSKPTADLKNLVAELQGLAELHFLDRKGGEVPLDAITDAQSSAPTDEEWSNSLTAMRNLLTKVSHARIVLGGRTEGYKGRMPGIAEEALLALHAGQPLYLLGGYGGCSRDIAVEIGLINTTSSEAAIWAGREEFQAFNRTALRNGLTEEENHSLAKTVHVDEAVALILRGLLRVAGPFAGSK